ncbi:hypothetical protein ACWGB8_08435 [Kitasatospora sp. NPDC054939]
MSAIVLTDRIRSLRAVVFATLCVALAATAHVSMAGSGVSAPVLAWAFALTLAPTWLLAGKRRGLALIGGWMTVTQTALHQLFALAGTARAGTAAGPDWASLLLCNPDRAPAGLAPADLARMAGLDPETVPAAGGHHGGHGAAHAASGSGGLSGPLHGMSAGMLAAHLLSALACALLLWRGEAALARLSDLLGALAGVLAGALLPLLALAVRPVHEPPAQPRTGGRPARLPRMVLLSHALVRRGPPATAVS